MSSSGEFSDLLLPFGQNRAGRLVHVSTVARGAACDCVCPQCGGGLIAKQGEVLRHHFSHGADACGPGALETSLHKMAKQIIVDAGRVWAPEFTVRYPTQWQGEEFRIDRRVARPMWIEGTAIPELAIGDFRPDVVIDHGGRTFAIEIFVTHAVDLEKRGKIKSANVPTIEIDLSGYPRSFELQALRAFVLRDASRFWINHHDEAAEYELARLGYHREYSRRQKERAELAKAAQEKAVSAWGAKWDAENGPEARARRQREKDFAEAAKIEAERLAKRSSDRLAGDLVGLLKVSHMRPRSWAGRDAHPIPGAFCSSCGGMVFDQTDGGWHCRHCVQSITAEAA